MTTACVRSPIVHCVNELVGWHTTKIMDRWTALEPLRCGIGSLGVPGERCPSLADYVVGMRPRGGAITAEGC